MVTGIQTFAQPQPTPAQLAAAMKLGGPTPIINQSVSQTAAATPPDSMIANTPFGSNYAQGLIDQSLKRENRSPWELAGNLAMLTSGYYHKSKDDNKQLKRDAAVGDYIRKNLPDMAPLWDAADTDQRKEIAKAARDAMLARAEEQRKRVQAQADIKPLIEGAESGADAREMRSRMLQSPNPAYQAKAAESYLDSVHEQEKTSRANAQKEAERQQRYQRGLKIFGGDEQKAVLYADGVTDPGKVAAIQRGQRQQAVGTDGKPLPADHVLNFPEAYDHAEADERKQFLASEISLGQARSKKIDEELVQSRSAIASLDQAETALERGLRTGTLGQREFLIRKALSAVGVTDAELAGAGDLLQAAAIGIARANRIGFPGAVSNQEMAWYFQAGPGLDKTPEGNRMIIRMLRWNAEAPKRELEYRNEWAKSRRDGGLPITYGSGYQQWMNQRAESDAVKFRETLNADLNAYLEKTKSQGSREQKLQSGRESSQPTPGASVTAPSSTGESIIEHNGKRYRKLGTGQYQEVDDGLRLRGFQTEPDGSYRARD